MLFVLNMNQLIIIYIILNYQINERAMHVISCYQNINWVVFEFVSFDPFIHYKKNHFPYLIFSIQNSWGKVYRQKSLDGNFRLLIKIFGD